MLTENMVHVTWKCTRMTEWQQRVKDALLAGELLLKQSPEAGRQDTNNADVAVLRAAVGPQSSWAAEVQDH